MSGASHAGATKTSTKIFANIGKIVVGLAAALFVLWVIGKLLEQPKVINNYYGNTSPVTQPFSIYPAQPKLVATQPVPAVDTSSPPIHFFHDLYSAECNAEETSSKSVCGFDIRGTPPLAATKAGLYLCFDPADGYWERWDQVSQGWFRWDPKTEFMVVSWTRMMPNEGANTPTTVSYWASKDPSCPAP